MSHLLSKFLLIVSTDIVKAITTTPKAEQPRKEIKAIISEVSVHCCSLSIYSYIPFSTNPNATRELLHSSPLFNTFTLCTADSEVMLTGACFFTKKKYMDIFD
jgi:hypothetical protein